jgi:aryl-alcohol dehydrogenase-like predicted oxidoreductase
MIDSADAYGNGHNETLVGRALRGRHSETFVATMFGIVFDEEESGTELPTGWAGRATSAGTIRGMPVRTLRRTAIGSHRY